MKKNRSNNFLADIKSVIDGEEVEAVVIGEFEGRRDDARNIDENKRNKRLTWEEAVPLLGYAYSPDVGWGDCHNVCIWTKGRIVYMHEYDGEIEIRWHPRNPPL